MAAVNYGGKVTESGKNTETPIWSIRETNAFIKQTNEACLNLLFYETFGLGQ